MLPPPVELIEFCHSIAAGCISAGAFHFSGQSLITTGGSHLLSEISVRERDAQELSIRTSTFLFVAVSAVVRPSRFAHA